MLTKPEARPESLGVAPDIASVISAGNADPGAQTEQQHHRQDVLDVAAVDRRPREQEQPGAGEQQTGDQRIPRAERP